MAASSGPVGAEGLRGTEEPGRAEEPEGAISNLSHRVAGAESEVKKISRVSKPENAGATIQSGSVGR